jgi:NAD(P)-dependent dehydrogenase (short-subunit alcohol dehydrogenase family)
MNRVDGKVALVTGGGGGIGQACCEMLAKAGAAVVVTDINMAAAEATAKLINQSGGKALALLLDVAKEKSWETVVEKTLATYQQLNILVNNAGIALPGECKTTTLADWEKVISINLNGVFLGIKTAINAMVEGDHQGSIVNISSGYGITGGGLASYSASKGGVTILTKSVAVECGRLGYNIRVNSVHPGGVETNITQNQKQQDGEQEGLKDYLKKVPMGRMGTPQEIAKGVLFLASDDASFITGSALSIDGGRTAS